MADEKKPKTELSDVEVLTIGLVDRPAIQKGFFLLKNDNQEVIMPEEQVIEVEKTNDPGWWDKLTTVLRKSTSEAVLEELDKAGLSSKASRAIKAATDKLDELGDELPEDGKKALKMLKGCSGGGSMPWEKPEEEKVVEEEKKVKKAEEEVTIEKSEELVALEKAQAELTALKEEVVKAQAASDEQKVLLEKRQYVDKAEEYQNLPLKAQELGEHLYNIAKAAPGEETWLTELLKAADNQLTQAGVFNEMGTSQAPEQTSLIEKAEKIAKDEGISVKQAYLKLSKEEQEELQAGYRPARRK